jgi:type I restriction enzyme, R subunit
MDASRIAVLAKNVQAGIADDTPEELKKSPGLRAIYNNLKKNNPAPRLAETPDWEKDIDHALELAKQIDATVKRVRPHAFRGHVPSENIIKSALLPLLNNDMAEVDQIFEIIKAQSEY